MWLTYGQAFLTQSTNIIADTLSEHDMAGPATHFVLEGRVKRIFQEIRAAESGDLSGQQCMLGVRAEANKLKELLKTLREPYGRNLRIASHYSDRIGSLTDPTPRDLQQLDDWCREAKVEFEKIPRNVDMYEELADMWQDRVYHRFVYRHKHTKLWQLHDCLSDIELAFMGLSSLVKDCADAFQQLNRIRQQLRRHLYGNTALGQTQDSVSAANIAIPNPPTEKQSQAGAGKIKPTEKSKGRQQDANVPAASKDSLSRSLSSFKISPSTVNAATWAQHNRYATESEIAGTAQPATTTPAPTGVTVDSLPNSLAMLQVVAPQAPTLPPPFAAAASFSKIEEKLKRSSTHRRAATEAPDNYTANTIVAGPPQLGSVVRRSGRTVPRVFTGSFDELEQCLHNMSAASLDPNIQNLSPTAPLSDEPNIRVNVRDFAGPINPPRPVNLQMQNGKILARRPNARASPPNPTGTHTQTQPPTQTNSAAVAQHNVQQPVIAQLPAQPQQVAATTASNNGLRSAPAQPTAGTSTVRVSSRHREHTI